MAWAAALVADLMFGSRLQGALGAAGIELELAGDRARLAALLAEHTEPPGVLLVDLGDPELDGAAAVEVLCAQGALAGARTLGFYSHVHPDQRERGERAGLDLVVPRSRLARDAPALVAGLAAR